MKRTTKIVGLVALILAVLATGAFAGSHYLITNIKQIKPSVRAQLRGNVGPPGVPGSPGSQGPAGPAGAQGPGGSVSLSGLTTYTASTVVPPGEIEGVQAFCPAGQHAVSGGGFNSITKIGDSQMNGAHTGWFIVVSNGSAIAVEIEATAQCAGAGQAVAARARSHAAAVKQMAGVVARMRTVKAAAGG